MKQKNEIMIAIEGTINNRRIYYLDIKQDLEEFRHTELKNWVLFVIEDNIKKSCTRAVC